MSPGEGTHGWLRWWGRAGLALPTLLGATELSTPGQPAAEGGCSLRALPVCQLLPCPAPGAGSCLNR